MVSKEDKIRQLREAAQSMVQGSLSERARKCGDPSCACAHDPARRHGPHLYLQFSSEQDKACSVYVPAELAQSIRSAHADWQQFLELGGQISAANRAQLLRELERAKHKLKAHEAKSRRSR
jgi:uncharacterized protein DUF6788